MYCIDNTVLTYYDNICHNLLGHWLIRLAVVYLRKVVCCMKIISGLTWLKDAIGLISNGPLPPLQVGLSLSFSSLILSKRRPLIGWLCRFTQKKTKKTNSSGASFIDSSRRSFNLNSLLNSWRPIFLSSDKKMGRFARDHDPTMNHQFNGFQVFDSALCKDQSYW